MTKKIEFRIVVGNELVSLYPKTTANNVYLTNGNTVESAISSLQSAVSNLSTDLSTLTAKVNTMEDKLDFDTVYMTGSNGAILNDGSGTNLVAIY